MKDNRRITSIAAFLLLAAILSVGILFFSGCGGSVKSGHEATEAGNANEAGPEPTLVTFDEARAMEHIRQLSTVIGARPSGTEAQRRAAEYIKGVFTEIGYENVVEQAFQTENGHSDRNIYVENLGTKPQWVVIVGAHYDSAEGTGSPGANDNASGVATMLELARVFRKNGSIPTLLFVAFGAEETPEGYDEDSGDYGSEYMAYHLQEIGGEVIGMINLDMVGVGDILYAAATLEAPGTLTDYFLSFANRQNANAEFYQDPGESDNESFESQGIPSLWIEWFDDPYYHTPQDSLDKIKRALIAESGHLLQDFLQELNDAQYRELEEATAYR